MVNVTVCEYGNGYVYVCSYDGYSYGLWLRSCLRLWLRNGYCYGYVFGYYLIVRRLRTAVPDFGYVHVYGYCNGYV